jgi:hypothetical protein
MGGAARATARKHQANALAMRRGWRGGQVNWRGRSGRGLRIGDDGGREPLKCEK